MDFYSLLIQDQWCKVGPLTAVEAVTSWNSVQGSIAVVDIRHNRFVTSIDLPNIHGLVLDPDDHRIYAAGSTADVVYSIDEQTFKATSINVAPHCNPTNAPAKFQIV